MRFSRRLPFELHPNRLAELLDRKRRVGARILDLTESNPTSTGIEYPEGFLEPLADSRAIRYEPEPFGLASARQTIGLEFGAPFERIVLSASTSEAYSWLFKLLCDPGDEVLTPRPSYPLFEHLAALESVSIRNYGLFYDHGWFIDFHTLRQAITDRARAVVVVNPNNPTGNFVRPHEWEELNEICGKHGLAIISDEVFRDYGGTGFSAFASFMEGAQAEAPVPHFRLNGLSKTVGLPQMKLAWIIIEGSDSLVAPALARLEVIADTYLSAGTPVQCALPSLLSLREPVQRQIRRRVRDNLAFLCGSGLRILQVDAGWYAIVVLPPQLPEEQTVERLLRERDVLVQPGFFYDFEKSGYVVLSLLTPAEVFEQGVGEIVRL
jgi:aspartate/methionine/tyrosine aminotransferase